MPFPDSEGVLHGQVSGIHRASVKDGVLVAWVKADVQWEALNKTFDMDHDTVGTDLQQLHEFSSGEIIQPVEITVTTMHVSGWCGIQKLLWAFAEPSIEIAKVVPSSGEQWNAMAGNSGSLGRIWWQFTSTPTPGGLTKVGLKVEQGAMSL